METIMQGKEKKHNSGGVEQIGRLGRVCEKVDEQEAYEIKKGARIQEGHKKVVERGRKRKK